jgi:hypothetical protein
MARGIPGVAEKQKEGEDEESQESIAHRRCDFVRVPTREHCEETHVPPRIQKVAQNNIIFERACRASWQLEVVKVAMLIDWRVPGEGWDRQREEMADGALASRGCDHGPEKGTDSRMYKKGNLIEYGSLAVS